MQKEIKYKKGHFTSVATKLNTKDRDKLVSVAKRFGMSPYELLQSLLLSLLRYCDHSSDTTTETEDMMCAFFNNTIGVDQIFNPLSLSQKGNAKIVKAILFIKSPDKKGTQLISVYKNEFGNIKESYNVQDMFIDLLNTADPEVLRILNEECEYKGYFCIGQALHQIVLQNSFSSSEKIGMEIKAMFKDNNRAENNKALEYGERTLAKQHYDPDSLERSQMSRKRKLESVNAAWQGEMCDQDFVYD